MARVVIAVACALLACGCETVRFYTAQIEGIGPSKLVPLYFQEKQYVEDRRLAAAVRGALAARGMRDVRVEVYLKEVSLGGDARALEVARSVPGVKAVRLR